MREDPTKRRERVARYRDAQPDRDRAHRRRQYERRSRAWKWIRENRPDVAAEIDAAVMREFP